MLIFVNAIAQFRKWYYLCTSKQMKYNNVMKQYATQTLFNLMFRFKFTRSILRWAIMHSANMTPGEALYSIYMLECLNYLDSKDDKNNG